MFVASCACVSVLSETPTPAVGTSETYRASDGPVSFEVNQGHWKSLVMNDTISQSAYDSLPINCPL